jgi:hypothetical protein
VFGRRSYARFDVQPASAGVLSVLRDVVVQDVGEGDVVAIAREPAAVGDVLTLERPDDDTGSSAFVRVVECRPIVVDGATRHRLRLRRTQPPTEPECHDA